MPDRASAWPITPRSTKRSNLTRRKSMPASRDSAFADNPAHDENEQEYQNFRYGVEYRVEQILEALANLKRRQWLTHDFPLWRRKYPYSELVMRR